MPKLKKFLDTLNPVQAPADVVSDVAGQFRTAGREVRKTLTRLPNDAERTIRGKGMRGAGDAVGTALLGNPGTLKKVLKQRHPGKVKTHIPASQVRKFKGFL